MLLAIETFPPDHDGWRKVGNELLAEIAGLSLQAKAFTKSRRELIEAGLLEHQPGRGSGNHTRWRIGLRPAEPIPVSDAPGKPTPEPLTDGQQPRNPAGHPEGGGRWVRG